MSSSTPAPASVRPVRVLLVEDDELMRRSFTVALERYGYRVKAAADGLTGLELFRDGGGNDGGGNGGGIGDRNGHGDEHAPGDEGFDLLILDVMLPGLDGIGLCRRVRETSLVPILMMSARGDGLDIVAGLEAGADDYVVKPVDTYVLVARIRSLLRRATYAPSAGGAGPAAEEGPTPSGGDLLVFGDLTLDTGGLEVFVSGSPVALTPTELKLLLEFAAHPGVVLERHTLLRNVWDYGWDGDSRVVDLCVQRLRRKLGRDRIETVRGFGYKLRR
ncbi:response regulator transcription factor [Streptomyces vinaceus]|uniref:response regulator transcription factor n=1 Tax=Streptomyces vinaceus TaxID=1960 RepID=UPI001988F0B0|nr:transcriptional regulatory protein CseB [Streptomyces vinaceus]